MEQEVSGLEVFQSGAFTDSEAFNSLMAEIMKQLRIIIIQQIQVYRAEQIRLATPAPTPKPTNTLSIFGDGKGNNVRVETPEFKYNYGYDKK